MIMSAKSVEVVAVSRTEVLIPLNKLKTSLNRARKTPHNEAAIEAYAASIAAKRILQNLVVEAELDGERAATGFYLVTIGEGRRLAQLLRVKRKEIKKAESADQHLRGWLRTDGLGQQSSRAAVHPRRSRLIIEWPNRERSLPIISSALTGRKIVGTFRRNYYLMLQNIAVSLLLRHKLRHRLPKRRAV